MSWRILGDWGTTRLRLFRVERGEVTDRMEGQGALSSQAAGMLRAAIAPWITSTPPDCIHLCGMAGARGGLHEVAYADCPSDAATWLGACAVLEFDGIQLRIMPGLASKSDDASDVMRGEETQIFGAISLTPALGQGEHTLLLPGTHSKWVKVKDGKIETFRTFMTGELFALLRQSSILPGPVATDRDDEADGFLVGLDRSLSGANPLGALFQARAAQVRDGKSSAWAQGFVSGLLIGGETREMRPREAASQLLWIIGAPELSARYQRALSGTAMQLLDADDCVLAGLGLIDAYN